MPGGWGDPRAPAHGLNLFIICHLAETVTPRTCPQPREHTLKPRNIPRTHTRASVICHVVNHDGGLLM